jgi:cytochrome c oxidase subunit II
MKWLQELFLPPQASTHAKNVDDIFLFTTVLSIVFFIIIAVAAIYFPILYKRRSAADKTPHFTHNLVLEIVWSVIPLFLVMIIFFWGFHAYMVGTVAPNDSLEIQAVAKKWIWQFEYPDGTKSVGELHVPFGRPVRVIMNSEDVLHSFFLKEFRVKADVLPNRYTEVWFQATQPGQYTLQCTEYCGKDHSMMRGKVYVDTPEKYEVFLKEGPEEFKKMPLVELGQLTWDQAGCKSCHSIDGTRGDGPTWKGIWGQVHQFNDGTSNKVDENYVRESILNPQAKIVKGFEGVMPTFQGALRERQILGVIEYMKTLK